MSHLNLGSADLHYYLDLYRCTSNTMLDLKLRKEAKQELS